ncbi:LOW QUALITY PROTEIN: protein HipA [Aggregatibacter actinomycetemcomitans serotype e str. SC1083]|uniref:Protein HipA n=1 Tax=Aggregatibacter actinomycetemcomitans serotype e str. SC1083 TaxID=907488 RepID=G4AAL5_AGGAC|nr:LOW QUALITY PROTEIN: protein HipA [Aggregatibacter actinomycetemcomitans serotype e str. SC1083]
MSLLNGSSYAQIDRKQFFQAQIIFWLLCTIDEHGKNF